MRTTIDLPDDLLKRAKIAAVERGVTLRDLVGDALERELGHRQSAPSERRTRLPIFRSGAPGTLTITNADITEMDGADALSG